jgi:2-amino-4-hydroxy-6-hydroxymethyldihydropteridine diphosphokinase
MILVALGGNLPHPVYGEPRATLEAALRAIAEGPASVRRRSRFYRTAPVPASDQPDFVNAVALLETGLSPRALLAALHAIEREFGRQRGVRHAARTLDLDLLAFDERVSAPGEEPVLPHPRLHERGFVLYPLRDVAPGWRHPRLGADVETLLRACREKPPVALD